MSYSTKKQQQRNQRPKTKTFPRFFFFFLFSLDAKFFFVLFPTRCSRLIQHSLLKQHTRLHTQNGKQKNDRKFNYHRQFHLPCSVYGNYGRQKYTGTQQHRTGHSLDANKHGHTHLLVSPIIKWNKKPHFFHPRVISCAHFLWLVHSSLLLLLLRIEPCFW